MTDPANDELRPGVVLQQRYEILERIGGGGFGEVYLARHRRFRQRVAVKKLRAAVASEAMREQFEKEAALLFGLSHRGLPKVVDAFSQEDGEFLVMEYVEGKDLGELLQEQRGPLDLPRVLSWADQILDALEYLHSRYPPVIHRDIKPQNVKLGPDGRVVLLDFGLAKGASGVMSAPPEAADLGGATAQEDPFGVASRSVAALSMGFSPLEQMVQNPTDERSDIYSLGATIYALLAYAVPEPAVLRGSATAMGHPDPLVPIRARNPTVPEAVERAILWAMAIHSEDRPPSASTFRSALRRAGETARSRDVASEAVLEAPATIPHTTTAPQQPAASTPSARGPARAAIVAALAMLGVLALGGIGWWVSGPQSPASVPPAVEPTRTGGDTAVDLGGGVWIELVYVPPGSFEMGVAVDAADRETPVHRVTITKGVLLGKYEVTQGQWKAMMGTNPSRFGGNDDLPVEQVSWDDCQEFIRRLNATTGGGWRLPTEAEWEYACRAGTTGDYAGVLDQMAWTYDNAGRRSLSGTKWNVETSSSNGNQTHPVGQKQPNAWGLYDMHGNVNEWCQDWYDETFYGRSPGTDPVGPATGSDRVVRGGSWFGPTVYTTSGSRAWLAPSGRSHDIGLRLAREAQAR